MGRKSYEQYGERARVLEDPHQATARLLITKATSRRIVHDIIHKIDLQPDDRLLDIGCGIGQLGIPLSFMVESYVGVDHPGATARFRRRCSEPNITLIDGNFLDIELAQTFTKILIYDTFHYLGDGEVVPFLEKALGLLEPRGKMLIGNLPNAGYKQRTLGSAWGQVYDKAWAKAFDAAIPEEIRLMGEWAPQFDEENRDNDVPVVDDDMLLGITCALRLRGYHAWILPQDEGMPMWTMREDVLVMRP